MHTGHAHLSYKPPSVAVPPNLSAPALEPLSPLSDLSSPSPPLVTDVQPSRTRLASGSTARPSQRRRDAGAKVPAPPPASTPAVSVRRIRPLACMTTNTNAQNIGKEKAMKANAWKMGSVQQEPQLVQPQPVIEFPPKHVVLHPDDVNNKVFLAMGRALMSMDNRAMTIKDLADLSMQHGLVCQNVSAASQAITFFIRSHLNRCEEQNDFPLLLRHVLSGTPKDDALAPALYSRTGGNVSNKDKSVRDENGNIMERATCFRRGTTVWYLSKAAGAPCPFARVGIALRDYAEGSAITSVEGRKGDNEFYRGLKRKRERNLRRRAGSGPAARRPDDDSDSDERTKPAKIKLTLRLRPSPANLRRKVDSNPGDESSSSSDSDSDSDAQDESMDIDTSVRSSVPPTESSTEKREPTWTFPPFPIQRRISIPPYTPSEEIYPTIYTSPTTLYSTSTFSSEWATCSKPKLTCVDPAPTSRSYHQRADSVPFSVASPPPDSDDEFGFGDDDDDDDVSVSMSPEIKFKREDEIAYVWPQAAPSSSSLDLASIKLEPSYDDLDGASNSKRSSTQTVKQENHDELDLDITSLSLSFGDGPVFENVPYAMGDEYGDNGLFGLGDGFSWGRPVDLTQDGPVQSTCEVVGQAGVMEDAATRQLWRNVELLGPDTIHLQELEDGSWEEYIPSQEGSGSPSRCSAHQSIEERDDFERQLPPTPSRSRASTLDSLSPPPSLASSVHTWSACSPETEIDSIGPASPPSYARSGSPAILRNDEPAAVVRADNYEVERSSAWAIPGKSTGTSAPSRQAVAVRSDDVPGIPLSEASAPWERGMCTEEDVEKHLFEPFRPLPTMSIEMPPFTEASAEDALALDPPLSPQEEAVFQSLCICPDTSRQEEVQTTARKQESGGVPELSGRRTPNPDTMLTNVFAAATTPTMRLRERRPTRRLAGMGQPRKRGTPCSEAASEEVDAGTEPDKDVDPVTPNTRKHEKGVVTAGAADNGSGSNSQAPLRRSKRVANAAIMQRKRERLRKRTVS